MTRVRTDISMSIDGYVAGPNQSEENPLGEGGMALHEWVFPLAVWRAANGDEGGETNASTPVLEAMNANVGAVIMGRNMFGGRGDWREHPWDGWWGADPPYHVPVFVLTHHEREPLVMKGGTTFNFVTDGPEAALAEAREVAGEQDVHVAGGARAVQQFLRAGLLDELRLHVVPVLLGSGERLLDDLGDPPPVFELSGTVEAPGVSHVTYRIVR
ncbi:MAG: dihydrofolate reductase family protein, partial [Actinomycetota bacterium]|nr:dihydrofolate reductase family protein [Actinomycetota bacterium]